MKKIKLSPFVHKVKGKRNWLLSDLLKGRIFKITPEGSLKEFKEQLIESDLAWETEGVIPFKFNISLKNYTDEFRIRELQVRLTGSCDAECRDCGQICACTKGRGEIGLDVLFRIIDQFKYIPIDHVLLTGGNPFGKWDVINKLKSEISAAKFSVLFQGHVDEENQKRLTESGINLISTANIDLDVKLEKMTTDAFSFFYNQIYNPCWGNKIAIDLDGSIKPCLWWNKSLGNIKNNQIKSMITVGDLDKYWNLKKDDIKTCNMCEYRYNCCDCRVSALNESGSLNAKLPGCRYDPGTGTWNP